MRSTLVLISFFFGLNLSSYGQEPDFHLSSELFGTRYMLGHHLGIQREQNKWRFGLSVGYNPDRLFRFQHFSGQLRLSANRTIQQNELVHVGCQVDFLASNKIYPLNQSIHVVSLFGGYGLSYGKKIQFIQSLSLGASYFFETTQDIKPFFVHDFKVMFGIRYLLNNKNSNEI